jgi:hypothetical protein
MLRQNYEQLRQKALEQRATGIGSAMVMQRGMRSWMEAGWREEIAPASTTPTERRLEPDHAMEQMAAVWASLLLGQAERSHRGL